MRNTTQQEANREVTLLTLGMVLTAIVAFICLGMLSMTKVEMGPLAGSAVDFTYYSEFHHNRKVIEATPGWTITDSWKHQDVTLEDFGFTVATDDGKVAEVEFLEGSPQMRLSDTEDIRDFVRKELEHGVAQ